MTESLVIFEKTQLTTPDFCEKLGDSIEYFLSLKSFSLSRKSVKTYTESLNELIRYFGSDIDVRKISTPDLLQWLKQIHRTPAGVFMCWQTAGFFFRWFFSADPEHDPLKPIHLKRPDRDPIKGITVEEVDKILKTIKGKRSARDRAIIAVLFSSALRSTEFCSLQLQDINQLTGVITVRSETAKGGKFRQVAITGKALMLIRKHIKALPDQDPAAPMWQTDRGSALKPAGIQDIISRSCSAAKIDAYSFHDFRRGCALQLHRSGADIKRISHFLGHADLKTTERYLALDTTDAVETAVLFDPLK